MFLEYTWLGGDTTVLVARLGLWVLFVFLICLAGLYFIRANTAVNKVKYGDDGNPLNRLHERRLQEATRGFKYGFFAIVSALGILFIGFYYLAIVLGILVIRLLLSLGNPTHKGIKLSTKKP